MKLWRNILIGIALFAAGCVLVNKLLYNEFVFSFPTEAIIGCLLTFALFTLLFSMLRKTITKILLAPLPEVELMNGEKLVLEDRASQFTGIETVGGRLTLTDKRLVFTSHKFNIQNHSQEFPLTEIKKVAPFEHHFSEKIFKVELANNEVHKFLVDSPADWISTIPR